MAMTTIHVHCAGVIARADSNNGTEWVKLAFKGGEDLTEIILFFKQEGAAKIFADHVNGAAADQEAKKRYEGEPVL